MHLGYNTCRKSMKNQLFRLLSWRAQSFVWWTTLGLGTTSHFLVRSWPDKLRYPRYLIGPAGLGLCNCRYNRTVICFMCDLWQGRTVEQLSSWSRRLSAHLIILPITMTIVINIHYGRICIIQHVSHYDECVYYIVYAYQMYTNLHIYIYIPGRPFLCSLFA